MISTKKTFLKKIAQTGSLGLAILFGFTACEKMDNFETKGALEFFMVDLTITPGMSQKANSKKRIPALLSMRSGKDGTISLAFPAERGSLSLRQLFLKRVEEEGAIDITDTLAEAGLDVLDDIEGAAAIGKPVPGSNGLHLKITGFESETPAIDEFGIQIEGYAKLDKKSKSDINVELLFYITLEDFESLAPGMFATLEVEQNGKTVSMSDIKDPNFQVTVLHMKMLGPTTTGFL